VTAQHFEPNRTPERASARADTLALADWRFTELPLNSAEVYFLTATFFTNPDDFPAMLFMVFFPGFAETVRAISGGNAFVEYLILVTFGTILLGGENPNAPEPKLPISPTT
jgi:hypothetical protein